MRPDGNAQNILSTTRATAKMHELRVAPEDFIVLPRDPSTLFVLAVGILGDVAATIAADKHDGVDLVAIASTPVPRGWGERAPTPVDGLRFASIFFDAFLNARLDDTITVEFSLLCASAYYLAGNIGSATVIIRRMEPPGLDLAGGLGRLVHAILANDFRPIDGDHAHAAATVAVLHALDGYMRFDNDMTAVLDACDKARTEFYENGSPRELLYGDLVAAICARKLRNASRTLLPAASDLDPDSWRPALAKSNFPIELWPAQQRIAMAGLLRGASAVIQMPTSAGKTRATQLIIRSAFLAKRASLAVIVAPYRSLCHDIRGDLSAAFAGEPIRLDEASDSYQFDLQLETLLGNDTVLIVTPEKLLYMLRRAPELAGRIGLVIYDEGHQFDSRARGPTYELLLTSLRMTLAPETQIVLISAVIGNAPDVAAWLIGDRAAVIGGEGLLPIPKSIAFASWQGARGQLAYVNPTDPDEREFFVPRIITDIVLPAKRGERTERRFPEKDGGDVGLFLGLHVVANGSVAIFCGRKDSAAKLCRRVVDIFDRGVPFAQPIAVSDAAEVEKIRSLSETHLGAGASATRAAALGIFAHHADTPYGMRLSIEHAMKEDLAKFVICTSTLAQGVNFPLRYLIVTSTRQGGEKILVRDFHNLMGRAGRAGMHTEGSVIFSSSTVYDQREIYRQRWRWQEAKDLLDAGKSEPCNSSILAIFDDYVQRQVRAPPIVQPMLPQWLDLAFADRERIEAVVNEALALQPNISTNEFRRFVEGRARAIQGIAAFLVANMTFTEEEDEATRVGELAANTLAYHLADTSKREELVAVVQAIGNSILAQTDGPQRAIIRRSPLPPAAVAELQAWLAANVEALAEATAENRLLDAVSNTILAYTSAQSIRSLSDADDVVPLALAEWVAGRSFAAIHDLLVRRKVRVSGDGATVEDAVALCENGFGYEVAMVVASLADLAEALDPAVQDALALLQRQVKNGLTEKAALAFLEAGFADRVVATALGQAWPEVRERGGVRAVCRNERVAVQAILDSMPSYFGAVAAELSA
jgi:hypothetical protein